jgi:hypothetical protein
MPDFIITKDVTGVNAGGSCSPNPIPQFSSFPFLCTCMNMFIYVADILRACKTSSLWTRQCPCSSSKLCVGI